MSDKSSGSRGQAKLITGAQPSYDEQFRARRKRYVIMMAMRIPCLIAAALLYHTPWLAILIILISIPLPWCAVLIANDGPARKQTPRRRPVGGGQTALPGPRREIVDAPVVDDAAGDGAQGSDVGADDAASAADVTAEGAAHHRA